MTRDRVLRGAAGAVEEVVADTESFRSRRKGRARWPRSGSVRDVGRVRLWQNGAILRPIWALRPTNRDCTVNSRSLYRVFSGCF